MAELALGIVGIAGTVDACIKFGKVLVQAYKDYGLVSQLEIVKELESGMARDQREIQSQTLRILQSKLEATTLAISKPEKYASSKRVKAIQFLGLRETLESTVAELESWTLKKASQTEVQDRAEPVREGLKLRQAFNTSGSVKLAEKVLQELE
ncbi:hypothetical protein FOC4_g10003288 [Fusarium odoratissimum]|uniref:Uncharacterized protein n=1 Tax=Fusarium oxysporum f. sp. cubense (strain race 4) TaxID=2502994 RepID=N1RZ68_FUSC4|nr:hypothetical protein FOC4_g10003288 [Fusarium odoratissimum]